MLRAPEFWYRSPGVLATALAPLGRIYAFATARRVARAPRYRPPVPVICLGNLVAGGAGKTPAALWLLERLAARGVAAHAISRGYGGRGARGGPRRVDVLRDRAEDVGDEPLLLAGFAPVWIGRDRAETARAAVEAGAGALVLDDGFQDPAVAKDLSLLVVDAATGFGDGLCIPAGPLREPPEAGLARADAVLLLGPKAARARAAARWPALAGAEIVEGEVLPREIGIDWRGERVLAFAGIARPEKFFATLRALGAEVVATRAFPDHAAFAPRALARLETEAARLGARLVTTEKDAVRLPPAFRGKAMPLPVALAPEDPAALERRLDALFGTAPAA